MHMGRLVRLMAVKIHAVWPHHQYGWHAFQYLTVLPRIPCSTFVNPRPGAVVGAETRQIPLPSILCDYSRCPATQPTRGDPAEGQSKLQSSSKLTHYRLRNIVARAC